MFHLNASVNYTFNGLAVPVVLSLMATFTTLIETPPPSREETPQLTSPSGYNWSITSPHSPTPPPVLQVNKHSHSLHRVSSKGHTTEAMSLI